MDPIAALHARLSADLPLAALLTVHRGQPAVFVEGPVPAEAQTPWVQLVGITADAPEDARDLRLRRLRLELRCVDAAAAGSGRLQAVAARVRALLQAPELELPGARVLAQDCAGPTLLEGDRHFLQRRLELRLLIETTAEEG